MNLVMNADSVVQSYWTHIHNDPSHAPPKFKGFNYLFSGILLDNFVFFLYKHLKNFKFSLLIISKNNISITIRSNTNNSTNNIITIII